MDSFWLAAYVILIGLAVTQSLMLTLQVWEHHRYVRSCMHGLDRHQPTGRAAVFAPCKGRDVDLEGNLRALLRQDYHDYEVTFIVESTDDPAAAVIRRLMAEHDRVATRLVIAGHAADCGQKVHNLRSGVAALSPQVQYLGFIDSDARPRPEWLRLMVGQLGQTGVGAVTGYRWFVPERDTLANHLLYSMNCDLMSLFGRSSHYLVWGGSWGMRRDVFESIDLLSAWSGTLSDDLVASRQLRRARCRVRFVPGCVVASPLDYSLGEMLSFLRRQYMVAWHYVPDWWAFALAASTFASLIWLSNLAALASSLLFGTPALWIPVAASVGLYLLGMYRGLLRQDLVGTYFPDWQQRLHKAARFDVCANPLARLVHWLGVLGSMFGRQIAWRAVRYRVLAGGQVRIAGRDDQPPPATVEPSVAQWRRPEEDTDHQPETLTDETVRYRKAG